MEDLGVGSMPSEVVTCADIARRLRILVVEDNDDGRETLESLLTLCGYEVELAADGRSGLERALLRSPEVVLIDIALPEIDGYELARRIRLETGDRAPRLIAMTGYAQPEDRRKAAQAGFDLFLVKPVETADLLQALTEAVRHRDG
jgi:CheY-like chemotaxis protein